MYSYRITKLNNVIWLPWSFLARRDLYLYFNTHPANSIDDIRVYARTGWNKKKILEARLKRERDMNNKKIIRGYNLKK